MQDQTTDQRKSMTENIAVIIVAGGRGSRMGGQIPKQFLPLGGKPILIHTLERFIQTLPQAEIIVTLPEEEFGRWQEIVRQYKMEGTHRVAPGGDTRFASVRNALDMLTPCDMVLIHDGVRPLVSKNLIHRTIHTAQQFDTAIPVTEPVDSFRIVTKIESSEPIFSVKSEPFDRNRLRAVQTPQAFRYELLKQAYDTPYDPAFTDDASVVERLGHHITLCEGERHNLKITTPTDLVLAEALLLWKKDSHTISTNAADA